MDCIKAQAVRFYRFLRPTQNINNGSGNINNSNTSDSYAERVNLVVRKVYTTDYNGKPVHWAVFPNGTVIMVKDDETLTANILVEKAEAAIADLGPVYTGTPSGDMNPVQLEKFFGEGCNEWYVIFNHSYSQLHCISGFYGVFLDDGNVAATKGLEPNELLFGGKDSDTQALPIAFRMRSARELDAAVGTVACTSFDFKDDGTSDKATSTSTS